ncbi:hypothetical protein AGMMS4952_27000 [Spirochaetia bacterium]|nr:hypothetical protein AGMMS4952_27000 [Spirochaetia bacterium]
MITEPIIAETDIVMRNSTFSSERQDGIIIEPRGDLGPVPMKDIAASYRDTNKVADDTTAPPKEKPISVEPLIEKIEEMPADTPPLPGNNPPTQNLLKTKNTKRIVLIASAVVVVVATIIFWSWYHSATQYYDRGYAHYDKGQYDVAIADYTESIRRGPRIDGRYRNGRFITNAFFDRGCAYYDKGQYDLAIVDFTESIRLNPNSVNDFYWLIPIYGWIVLPCTEGTHGPNRFGPDPKQTN